MLTLTINVHLISGGLTRVVKVSIINVNLITFIKHIFFSPNNSAESVLAAMDISTYNSSYGFDNIDSRIVKQSQSYNLL